MTKFNQVFLTTGQVVLSLLLIVLLGVAAYLVVIGHSFLFGAYIATWLIHVFYLGTLARRFSRLRQQLRELGKGK